MDSKVYASTWSGFNSANTLLEVRVGEELPVWVLTGESLTALDSAIKDEVITLDKLRETAHKLQELSQNE